MKNSFSLPLFSYAFKSPQHLATADLCSMAMLLLLVKYILLSVSHKVSTTTGEFQKSLTYCLGEGGNINHFLVDRF